MPKNSTFDELRGEKGKQVSFGAIPGSTVEHAPILVKEALHLNLKVVSGYKGTADVRLALDSGEVDGFFNTWTSSKITSFAHRGSADRLELGAVGVTLQLLDMGLHD